MSATKRSAGDGAIGGWAAVDGRLFFIGSAGGGRSLKTSRVSNARAGAGRTWKASGGGAGRTSAFRGASAPRVAAASSRVGASSPISATARVAASFAAGRRGLVERGAVIARART